MMLSRELIQPIDLIPGTADLNSQEKDPPDYGSDLRTNISECHEIAKYI